MNEHAKHIAFRGIGAAEKIVRGFGTGRGPLDPAKLRLIRNFIVPAFEPYLGSIIHETPVLEALRIAVPDAQIVVPAAPLGVQVLEHNPMLSRLEAVPDPNREFLAAVSSLRRIVQSFGGEPWCALFTAWNSRSRVALAMMLAGGGVRAGYCVAPELLDIPLGFDRSRSQIDNNLRVVACLGHPAASYLEPRVYFSQSDLKYAQDLTCASDDAAPTAVLVTRTSGAQPTAWPDARFIAVARHLIGSHRCRILLPGTSRDTEALSRMAREIGPAARSLAGKTTVAQLAAVCALSDIAVCVDTGGMHVARSQGVPLVIIAPAWQDSVEWMPLGQERARILKGPWFPAPPPSAYAIEEVSVEHVVAAADELLRKYGPSPQRRLQRIEGSLMEPTLRTI